jgi:hypothetical protein
MDTLTTSIIMGVITLITSILAGVAIHRSNRRDDTVEKNTQDITILQQVAVTDGHVRKIIKEELQPLSLDSEKMLAIMHNIELYIAEEKGFKAARVEAQRRITDTQQ